MDVRQTKHYIKLNNPSYIKKIIQEHQWMVEGIPTANCPIPMSEDKDYLRQLESAELPSTEEQRIALQVEMKFNYRQAIGELIYAMVTCRPDISFPLIKLSQYSANPARMHYEAVINIFRYLNATIDDGLLYWRTSPMKDLPDGPIPKVYSDNHIINQSIHPPNEETPITENQYLVLH